MNEKIILVDDDNHILTSVSVALRNEGWQVETYPDGEKGLIALQKNIPDLVILDIKMPRIDGMEMLKRLRICLLYTSPSPRDLTASRMPSSA